MSAREKELFTAIEAAFLPENPKFQEQPPYPEDFSHTFKETTLNKLLAIQDIYSQIEDVSSLDKSVLIPLLCLCGENVQSKPWTDAEHIQAAYAILKRVKKVNNIFTDEDCKYGGLCLTWLNERLSGEDRWRQRPGLVAAFVWLLNQFVYPVGATLVGELMPMALRLTDDWNAENRVTGLICLQHLIVNSIPTHLTLFGRADLLSDTLDKTLHCRETTVLDAAYNTYIDLLTRTCEKTTTKADDVDRLTMRLLQSMETESCMDMKRCLGDKLRPLLELQQQRDGLQRWYTRLIRTVDSVLAFKDIQGHDTARLTVMENLMFVLDNAEDVRPYARDLLEMLTRLLYGTSKEDEPNAELVELCVVCLEKVVVMCGEESRLLLEGMEKETVNDKFDTSMKRVLKCLE